MERRRQIAFTVTRGAPDGFAAESFSRVPLPFDDYSEAVRNHNQWQRAIRREDDDGPPAYLPGNEAAIRGFVANFRRGRHSHAPTAEPSAPLPTSPNGTAALPPSESDKPGAQAAQSPGRPGASQTR